MDDCVVGLLFPPISVIEDRSPPQNKKESGAGASAQWRRHASLPRLVGRWAPSSNLLIIEPRDLL
jgi:hypothetical protein